MRTALIFLFIFCSGFGFGQKRLSGLITNEANLPLAGAEIFVKNAAEMRTVADANGYYEMYLNPGEYYLVFTADGYQDREAYLGMRDAESKKDMGKVMGMASKQLSGKADGKTISSIVKQLLQ